MKKLLLLALLATQAILWQGAAVTAEEEAIQARGEIASVFIAAALLVVVPSYIRSSTYQDFQPVAFGALAMYAATRQSGGGRFAAWWERFSSARPAAGEPRSEAGSEVPALVPAVARGEIG